MKRIVLCGLLAITPYSMASSLQVYQDKAFYTYLPHSSFIGMTQNVQAKCDGESVSTEHIFACTSEERLCKLLDEAKKLNRLAKMNTENSKVLTQLISLPQPNVIDASSWIGAAKKIGEEKSRLEIEKEKLTFERKRLKRVFERETRSTLPLALEKKCDGEVELALPYGYITFSTYYEATLFEQKIKVSQKLSVVNNSGIDIKADTAHFSYRSTQQYIRPVRFYPWTVEERRELPAKSVPKRMLKRVQNAEPMLMETDDMPASPAPMVAKYEDAREYTIDKLELPSTGEPRTVPVVEWEVPLTCRTELYPYRNLDAFEVCRFIPKFQIEQDRWRVLREGKIINERGVGEYAEGSYRLYTDIDHDIRAVRRRVVLKERQTGIFGSTLRKKDGFTLTLVNKSDKKKKLFITERIPTSTTEKVKVRLLSVTSTGALEYHLRKEGKVEMSVVLAAKETQKIEVLFEISYNKDIRIDY